MSTVIRTERVSKAFAGKLAVDGVTMRVAPGSIHGLIGANGAGKSTLLRMMVGLMEPTSGWVEVLGQRVRKDADALRQRLHLVGEDVALPGSFRVMDLIQYGRFAYRTWDEGRCRALLKALQLPERAFIRSLSRGMKMQLRLLMALSARPQVLLLDEPTNGLDAVVKRQFLQLIVQEVAHTGMSVVFATHHLDELERIADAVTMMYSGRVVMTGELPQLQQFMKRVQAVLPDGLPFELRQHPNVVQVEESGQFCALVVDGGCETAANMVQALRTAGATYTEVVNVGVEELLRLTLSKEGYTRDGILLS
ncbi:ABC transporter ATP-binding protein [Alicyclobacillus contaminans]|uniref:ABC transporter ATP-binding protein n=1 Tax=Alicyclobacillus contaminans TaxID=392016 RepID=UPI000400D14C|nr:ABC transporter ATP-binding protein [Alicyclobacillus contaminans]GMA51984.1 ABC transporter ATP-binding protein [Alicyclobacillus contaminans]